MRNASSIAFKEWAAVCLALRTGRQTVVIRKGGIHEGHNGFRVAHDQFWLFPTYRHESATGLIPAASDLLVDALRDQPPADQIELRDFVVVTEVHQILEESQLVHFRSRHVLSDETLLQRFHYRHPGLFILSVDVFTQSAPWRFRDESRFGGCHSWVDLPRACDTAGLQAVAP